jgi:hypothetical protein
MHLAGQIKYIRQWPNTEDEYKKSGRRVEEEWRKGVL